MNTKKIIKVTAITLGIIAFIGAAGSVAMGGYVACPRKRVLISAHCAERQLILRGSAHFNPFIRAMRG